uniref:Uncharacterized protein n=1 Tax=Magallana gigas TaxID=29159 RepID=K1RVG7_MAGGI
MGTLSEVYTRLDQGQRRYAPEKDFSHNSSMTLTLDLETSFKVTTHSLPKGTLQVKNEPDWAKGREDMLRTRDLGWTEGQTQMDGEKDG